MKGGLPDGPASSLTVEQSDATTVLEDADLGTLVRTSLDTAVHDNGCMELLGWTAEAIAADLMQYDGALGLVPTSAERLVPHVRAWLRDQAFRAQEHM